MADQASTPSRDGPAESESFVSTYALQMFGRLGFETSSSPLPVGSRSVDGSQTSSRQQAAQAFARLDAFLSAAPLTVLLAELENKLAGADADEAAGVSSTSGFGVELIDSALVVRERVGLLDTVIHAGVITCVLPLILEDGERLRTRPSLGAGNDPGRLYDLETNRRVAEFKLSSWKGQDGARERGLFADVVGLSLDESDRRREMYVVGNRPARFLQTGGRNAAKVLSKAALRLRAPGGLSGEMTVAEYTRYANVEVIDLRTLLPMLR